MTDKRLEEIREYWLDNGGKDISVMAETAEVDIPYLLRRLEAAEKVIGVMPAIECLRHPKEVEAWEEIKRLRTRRMR